MARYYVEKGGRWNIFSTVVDDFLYSEFMTFANLKRVVVDELVADKLVELETLKTDNPTLNKMSYKEALNRIYKGE